MKSVKCKHRNCLIRGEMPCPAGFTLDFSTDYIFLLLPVVRCEESITEWKDVLVFLIRPKPIPV